MRGDEQRTSADDAIGEEFRAHLDQRAADLVRQGLSESAARRRARLEFGSIESYKEVCREARRTRTARTLIFVEQIWREFRWALRRLWATPVFTFFAVASLALGLGVTTAIYATIDGLVWNTSSIEDARHLVVITRPPNLLGTVWRLAISKPDFDDLRRQVRSVPALAASSLVASALNDGARTSEFLGQAVTGNYFATTRLPLFLGRGIQESDDHPGADPVVVLSHDFWQSKTSGDPAIVGRTVRIAGHPFGVIGVVAESIHSTRDIAGQLGLVDGDVWIPSADKPLVTDYLPAARDEAYLVVVARLPATTAPQVFAAEVGAIGAGLDRAAPIIRNDASGGGLAPRSWSAITAAALARETAENSVSQAGAAVVLLVGLVLVVACTNIANLTLGRGASRMHEFAVRRALGATRGRLIREQCMESVLLAGFGAFSAALVARALCQFLTTEIPSARPAIELIALRPSLNAPTLLPAGSALLVSLFVFGIIPALQLTRSSLRERMSGDALSAAPTRWKGRRQLITWQVAISTAFVLMAAASMRAIATEAAHDPGFDLRHIAVGGVSLIPLHGDRDRARRALVALDREARAQPGFTSVALTAAVPIGSRRFAEVSTEARPSDRYTALTMAATPGIFRTLGVPILRGRAFGDQDTAATTPVIVTSERVARDLFGTTDIVGREVVYVGDGPDPPAVTTQVIGVARDTDTLGFLDRRIGGVYVPLSQQDAQNVIILGRTAGDPAPMVRTLAGIVRQADPDLAVESASTGERVMMPKYFILRAAGLLSGWLSILAITLAMLGLYGVLSHVVARRTREIGLRLALGAEAARVRRMIVGDGLRPVAWGLGLGLFVGAGARIMFRATGLTGNISAIDPLAFIVAAVTLTTAGLCACYVPARRASKVDPNVALRQL